MAIELTPDEMRLAADAARRAAWRWSGVEEEDLRAHLWAWLCQHYDTVLRYRDEQFGVAMLATALKRESLRACRKEQTAAQHAPIGSQTDYDKGMVERALPFIWDYNNWHQTTTPSSQTDEAITILADISATYHTLSEQDRDLLAWRHREGETLAQIATRLGTTEEAARKRYAKAMRHLLEQLSGVSPKWDGVAATNRP